MKYAKQVKLADELVDELRKRCSTYIFTTGFDANGWPTISMTADATPATTEDNVFIRIRPRDWDLNKDIIGNDQIVYVPSVIQIATEANGTPALMLYVTKAHALAVLAACLKRGCRTEIWEETNGSVPAVTTFATANKQKTANEPDLDWPLLSSQ